MTAPALAEGQDQAVLKLDLRRQDPPNPEGDSVPDLASVLENISPEVKEAFNTVCTGLGFDPALSYVAIVSVVDVEEDGGAISIADLQGTVG